LAGVVVPAPSALKIFEGFPAFSNAVTDLRTEALNKDISDTQIVVCLFSRA
jgi:hypothetical protein